MYHRIFLPRGVEVVVASFGGVGTTFLCDYISRYRTTNSSVDADGLKHSPLPPIVSGQSIRIVYVFGDPIDAAASLFRRGYHTEQSSKLQRYSPETKHPIPRDMTLDEYAALGQDRFLFERHFRNWHETWLSQPTLFLRYESVFENKAALIDFLDLPAGAEGEFPEKRSRNTNATHLSDETLNGLEAMYGDFQSVLRQLPDAEVRLPERRQQPSWSCPVYRQAILAQYSPRNLLRTFWETSLRPHWKRTAHAASGNS